MTDDLERLERRVAQLETLVRALLARSGAPAAAPSSPPPPLSPAVRAEPHPGSPPIASPARSSQSVPAPRMAPPFPPPPASTPRSTHDLEQWVGQRGLLIVGVLALLATGGFFLNYAFERGWIPEWLRATAAVAAGLGVAAWGDRLVGRGLRRYGAGLIGAGGGLVYLGFWAAAGPYALVGKEIGIGLLALTSCGVTLFAVRHEVEALAVWALTGAYLAPAFLPQPEARVVNYLAYNAVIGVGALVLGYRMVWRVTLDLALFGFYLLPAVFVLDHLDTPAAINYLALGGVVALFASGRTGWPEARLGAVFLPWFYLLVILGLNGQTDALRWTALGAGAALAATVWWQQSRTDPFARSPGRRFGNLPELVVYLVSPLALVCLAAQRRPDALAAVGAAVPLALAALYLGAGWPGRRPHLVGMGLVLVALAVSGQWDGPAVAAGWALVGLAAVTVERSPTGRAVAAGLAVATLLQLFTVALPERPAPPVGSAFTDAWALGWYGVLVALTVAARAWPSPRADREDTGRIVLCASVGVALLLGGSVELLRVQGASFAGYVALSVFWSAYAAALVRTAPRWRDRRLRLGAETAAVALCSASLVPLFGLALPARPAGDPALFGVWSVGWYAVCAAAVLGARWWTTLPGDGDDAKHQGPGGEAICWTLAGLAFLAGGSVELHRFFTVKLAANLAISTFWLVSAGALVRLGFWWDRKAVRSAGLAVASLAALKVVLYDLSELEALYRVASFFALALVALAVAYAYNRRASAELRTAKDGGLEP
ncbi:MAG: DUF2339 domain-containing protein [Gemmatimonadales bacterium]